jgi:hypothetical protein
VSVQRLPWPAQPGAPWAKAPRQAKHAKIARYDIRSEFKGWTVYDTLTGSPAVINHVPQTSLTLEHADDLADLLNHLHSQRASASTH